MDQRIIVTTPFFVYLALCGLFGLAQSTAEAPLTQGQPAFIAIVGLVGPLVAIGLILFFLHDNPANVFAVSGDGSTAFLASTVGLIAGSVLTAGVGCWLWYRKSPGFRSAVDNLVGPSETRN